MITYIKKLIKSLFAPFESRIPPLYLRGYRRLADNVESIKGQHCWNCRHAIAYVSWHCERDDGCKWERCYCKDELSWIDKQSTRWLKLPPEPKE